MSDNKHVTIPPEIKKRFPKLISLILGSESMNDEERQYWINILPVMTPQQIENLGGILQNEKDQLAAIDAKYRKEMAKMGKKDVDIEKMSERRRKRRESLRMSEQAWENKEDAREKAILEEISGMESSVSPFQAK